MLSSTYETLELSGRINSEWLVGLEEEENLGIKKKTALA